MTNAMQTTGKEDEKATTKVNKEVRIYSVDVPSEYTDLDKQQCSIDALLNGGECEACQ